MEIIVENKEERLLIESFCDVALKADGIKNLNGVNKIMSSVKDKKKEKDK